MFVLLVLCVALACVSQVSADDIDNTTLTTTDEVDEIQLEEESVTDLLTDSGEIEYQSFDVIQQKINNAKSGDTIYLSGYYKGTGEEITIDKRLTIQGPEDDYAYLTADGLSRIFYVESSGVTLKNLVMKAGDAGSYDGGAVYCESYYQNCKIDNCIIGYCEAYYGGATYYCDVYNSAFLANSATRGGAMYGGNAYNTGFANNTATERGGAIYLRDGVTVDRCEFENNTVDEDGGAIYSCAGYNTVSNSNFKNNYAGDDGGAIYNNDEYGSGLTVQTCDFRFNEADDDGGAIFTDSSASTTVKNSYFWDNKAGYWGGAILQHSTLTVQIWMVEECIMVKLMTVLLHGTLRIIVMELTHMFQSRELSNCHRQDHTLVKKP